MSFDIMGATGDSALAWTAAQIRHTRSIALDSAAEGGARPHIAMAIAARVIVSAGSLLRSIGHGSFASPPYTNCTTDDCASRTVPSYIAVISSVAFTMQRWM